MVEKRRAWPGAPSQTRSEGDRLEKFRRKERGVEADGHGVVVGD